MGITLQEKCVVRCWTVHPHARGDHAALEIDAVPHQVHPHARGDHKRPSGARISTYGSPPRAWGSPAPLSAPGRGRRFTPTRVGITSAKWPLRSKQAVHPHARGDHLLAQCPPPEVFGSPPRAWGSRRTTTSPSLPKRFTPTRVGITDVSGAVRSHSAVHPHARGDHGDGIQPGGFGLGSPPRAWGSRAAYSNSARRLRFTPTRVGITLSGARRGAAECGSPPRAWGSRWLCPPGLAPSPVHPHARGDHWRLPTRRRPNDGSPPRAWGSRI